MTLLPYLRRIVKTLDDYHAKYLDKRGGWRQALLLGRALDALEQLVDGMETA